MTYPIDPDNGLLVSWNQTVLNPVQKLALFSFAGAQKKSYNAMPAFNNNGTFFILDTFSTGDIATANWYASGIPLLLDKDANIKQSQLVNGKVAGIIQGGYYVKDEQNILFQNAATSTVDYYDITSGTRKTNLNLKFPNNATPFFEQSGIVYSFIISGNYPGPYSITFYRGLIAILTVNNIISIPITNGPNVKYFSPTGDVYIMINARDQGNTYVTTYIFKYNVRSNVFSTYFSSTNSGGADAWISQNYFVQDVCIDYAGNVYAVMSTSTGNPNITMQLIKITGSSSFSVLATLDSVNDGGNDLPVMSIATLYTNTVEFSNYANVAKTPYPSTIETYKVIPPDIPVAPIINV